MSSRTIRRLLTALCAFLLIPAAAASANLRSDVNALRVQHDLAPLTASDPIAAQIANRLAAQSHDPNRTPLECGCLIDDPSTGAEDAGMVYDQDAGYSAIDQASNTNDTHAAFWTWNARASLAQNLARYPAAYALVLDPRARTFDVAASGGHEAFGVTVDWSARWTSPILAFTGSFSPISTTPLWVVMPPAATGNEYGLALQLRQRGRWRTLMQKNYNPESANTIPVGDGSSAQSLGVFDNVAGIPYASTLRVTARGISPSPTFTTPAEPASLSRRSWRFDSSMSRRDRSAFLAAVADARPEARTIFRQFAPFTVIHAGQLARTSGELGQAQTPVNGLFKVTFDMSVFTASRAERDELILHELGHITQFSGLSDAASKAIGRLHVYQGRCSSNPYISYGEQGPCAPNVEWFADSFSKWSLRETHFRSDIGYHVLPPRSMTAFGRLVTNDYRLVPETFPVISSSGDQV